MESNYTSEMFSIIVPCYNVEDYVVNCVEKLLKQTYENIEILLIEDGSQDNTLKKCQLLEEKYEKVHLFTHNKVNQNGDMINRQEASRNLGQEASRNLGLEASKGDWICFVDADDWIEDDTLELIYNTVKNRNVDFVLFGLRSIYEKNDKNQIYLPNMEDGGYRTEQVVNEFFENISWNIVSCVGTKIYKREFIEKYNLRFEKKYKYNEDGAFAISAFFYAECISIISAAKYYYLQRQGSIMHSYRENAFTTLSNVDDFLVDLLKKYNVYEKKKKYVYERKVNMVLTILYDEVMYKSRGDYCKLFKEFKSNIDIIDSFDFIIRNTYRFSKLHLECFAFLQNMRRLLLVMFLGQRINRFIKYEK